MLGDEAVNDKDLEGLLELRVPELEQISCVLQVSDLLDIGPLEVDFWEFNCFLLAKSDAELIQFHEATD